MRLLLSLVLRFSLPLGGSKTHEDPTLHSLLEKDGGWLSVQTDKRRSAGREVVLWTKSKK